MPTEEFELALNEMQMSSPFKRKNFVAMLLGFSTLEIKSDHVEDSQERNIVDNKNNVRIIKYGDDVKNNLGRHLKFSMCKRLLVSRGCSQQNIDLVRSWCQNGEFDKVDELLSSLGISEDVSLGGWTYFRSYSLEGKGFHSADINHRLYLRITLDYRHKFVSAFLSKCASKGMPYYFKVAGEGFKTDSVVIYTDTLEHLKDAIDIINEIYADPKYQDLKDHTKMPPGHLFKVDERIGYGFEPKLENGKTSYTLQMGKCISHVRPQISALKNQMLSDFASGKLYTPNRTNVMVPQASECMRFSSMSKTEQEEFFNKYFGYIISIYGEEITNILDEIEQEFIQPVNKVRKSTI